MKKKCCDLFLWDIEPLKIPLNLLSVGLLLKISGLGLRVGCYPSEPPVRNTNCSFASGCQWETDLGLCMGSCVHFFQPEDPVWCRHMQALCVIPQSHWVHVSSIPSGSSVCSGFSTESSPSPEGRDFTVTFFLFCFVLLLRVEYFKVLHFLCIAWLWVSVFVHICWRRQSFSDNVWAKYW